MPHCGITSHDLARTDHYADPSSSNPSSKVSGGGGMSGVFSIHNAAPPLPATAWPTTMVADGTSRYLQGWVDAARELPTWTSRGPASAGSWLGPGRSPTDLISYPSVQYLARRDIPPLPVAPNNRGAHRPPNTHPDKRKTIYSFPSKEHSKSRFEPVLLTRMYV